MINEHKYTGYSQKFIAAFYQVDAIVTALEEEGDYSLERLVQFKDDI